MTETKQAIRIFHYTEKIKSNLITAFNLLEFLGTMKDDEIAGSEKLLATYFNALIQEANVAANATTVKGFSDVSAKLEEAIEQIKQHDYANAMRLVSEAISIATTSGNKAAETLKEKELI